MTATAPATSPATAPTPADEVPWRIVTWNVRGAGRPDLSALAAVIGRLRPDVVAIQEIRRGQATDLAARLGWNHQWARKHHPYTPLGWWLAEGHALLSRHPLRSATSRVISPGVSTWTYRHRVLQSASVIRRGVTMRFHNTHLAAHDRPDERIAQAERAAAFVGADGGELVVVAGDFNADHEAEVVRPFHALGLRDPGGGPTHPAIAPRRRFDYVLVPAAAEVIEQHEQFGGEEWAELSDHIPVLVEFHPA